MIRIIQSSCHFAAPSGKRAARLRALVLVLVALGAVVACRNESEGHAANDALVRPASAIQSVTAQPAEPVLPAEPAELPRGVSAPELSAQEAAAQAEHRDDDAEETEQSGAAVEPNPPAQRRATPPSAAPVKKSSTAKHGASADPTPASKPPSAAQPVAARPSPGKSRTTGSSRPQASQPTAAEPLAGQSPALPAAEPVPQRRPASVQVPSTDHVRVDVPSGLQQWLDADDRMRPWLGKAIAIAESCYAKVRADDPGASGTIALSVTMHENARPSGRVASAAPAVNGIVMCATTRLLGIKMPLFTGKEGETYSVRVQFMP